jgi:hypothetical protein
VDYKSVVVYEAASGSTPALLGEDLQPMGESDVKFCRYCISVLCPLSVH